MIQLVIEIPEEMYQNVLDGTYCGTLYEELKNGTPLPRGHGRLIDADELEEVFGNKCVGDCGCCISKRKTDGRGKFYDTCYLIDEAHAIIEADRMEERNEKNNDRDRRE